MRQILHSLRLKIILFFFLGVVWMGNISEVRAQQDPSYTMYMFNNLYFNPAYAGVADYISGALYYRNQWANFKEAPVTQNLSFVVPFKRKHIGAGLNVVNDQIGITGNTNVTASFAYYLNLKEGKLSFGLSAGLQQYRVDGEKVKAQDYTDDALINSYATKITPDFGFGIMYSKQRYYVGFSVGHINGAGRSLTGYYSEGGQRPSVARHYYLTGGYNIDISEKFVFQPSFLARFSESNLFEKNVATDVAVKLEYMEMVWFGTSYRTGAAMNFFVGLNLGKISSDVFKENIKIGYAFDVTNTRVPGFTSGSHELFVSYFYIPKVKRMMPKFK